MSSDYVAFDALVDHAPARLWEILGDPEVYPRFFTGISSCERVPSHDPVHGTTYHVRVDRGSEGVTEFRLQALINRQAEKLVLATIPDTGSWVSVHLSPLGAGRTRLALVFFNPRLPVPGGHEWSKGRIRSWMRAALARVRAYLAGDSGAYVVNRGTSGGYGAGVLRTLMRSGVVGPGRPDRVLAQLRSVGRWGYTLVGGYSAAAAREPGRTALVDGASSCTYGEIDHRTDRLAAGLAGVGVGPRSTVGVLARNHIAMMESVLACGKLGASVVLLNTALAGQQVEDAVDEHGVGTVILDEDFEPLVRYLPDGVQLITTGPGAGGAAGLTVRSLRTTVSRAGRKPPARPGSVVVMTSGTSGTPRGALRPSSKGLGSVAAMLSRIPLRVGERMLISAPIFHAWGMAGMLITTPLRATVVLQERFDAEACLRTIAEQQCTALFAIPIMLRRILDLPAEVRQRYDTSSLRVVASSGSAMSGALVTEFMDTFGDVLYNFYGSTEVSWGTVADPADLRAAPTTAGKPPLGTRLGILDVDGAPVPPGATGRIFVGNEMLFHGYTDGSSREVRDSLMDTGDLGYVDANGRLFVSGRQDEMVISGGENVFPRTVEEALAYLPQVADVAVVGVDDDEFGQRLAAYIVLHDGARLDAGMVRAYVRHRLPRFAVPRDVVFTDELPRNPTGKLLKHRLMETQWLASRF
ncbi:Acyl-CoA synthetase (AMP-forming)/AMP-acid ligase II [Haloechinothrix alba]|uniref:Acyl-CoA synthetase (AMP-forming)/AMP-acid ligase II n=1 Tax=Haloechinothrix alba TaxID=664784 RepID=A0A238VGJ1_9PSEU|nr:AMP-binding protein [Haloechinothrix alba]SNR33187.1 Acyl-CoA synthetase (AMP-forming)/AMP-acid ligase II [Haloechinothrix alba]